jgi:hypothetical protein
MIMLLIRRLLLKHHLTLTFASDILEFLIQGIIKYYLVSVLDSDAIVDLGLSVLSNYDPMGSMQFPSPMFQYR